MGNLNSVQTRKAFEGLRSAVDFLKLNKATIPGQATRVLFAQIVWAMMILVVAWIVRWLLNPVLEDHLPYVTYFAGVAVAAWIGGVRTALMVLFPGFFFSWYFFVAEQSSFSVPNLKHLAGFTMYFMVTFAIVAFAHAMHRAQAKSVRDAEHLRTTIESIGDGVITTDNSGIITNANRAAERICDVQPDAAIGKPLDHILRILEEDSYRPVLNPAVTMLRQVSKSKVLEQSSQTGTYVLQQNTGEDRWLSLTASLITPGRGQVYGAVVIIKDISDERQMLTEIREQTAAAQRMAVDLSEAHQRKDEFLATLAHELRNPLAPVRTTSQVLRSTEPENAKIIAVSDMLDRQVGQLSRLIDDLLDVSNITLGEIRLRRETIELSDTVTTAIEAAEPALDEACQKLLVKQPETPVYLYADKVRITQLIGNLLSNASKFSPPKSEIKLEIVPAEYSVAIMVSDQGIGLESARFKDIFDLFVQVDTSLGRQRSGSGIGLTIVKRLVAMHGGTVQVESEGLGKGCTFTVTLPVTDETPMSPPEAAKPPKRFKRFLVVDDNVDAADAIATMLGVMGFETEVAHDGREAIAKSEKFKPHVILLDIGMPVLDGYKTCEEIRKKEWGAEPKIVALTGWGREEDRKKAAAAGFNAHLVKPVRHQDLLEAMAKLPEKSEQLAD